MPTDRRMMTTASRDDAGSEHGNVEQLVDIAIVVVIFNSLETIERSIASIFENYPKNYSTAVTVVDNGSSDAGAQLIRDNFPTVKIVRSDVNLGFGNAANLGMGATPGRYYYLHQSDGYLQENVLDPAIDYLEANPQIGVAGLPLVFPDQSPQTGAYAFSTPVKWTLQGLGVGGFARWLLRGRLTRTLAAPLKFTPWGKTFLHAHMGKEGADDEARSVDWVCGAAMIIREEVRTQLKGGFDPRFFLYCEDEDICIEARQRGWGVEQLAVTPVIHDFGWGKNKKASPRVIQLKYENTKKFVNKHFKGVSWLWMRTILEIKHFWWRRA